VVNRNTGRAGFVVATSRRFYATVENKDRNTEAQDATDCNANQDDCNRTEAQYGGFCSGIRRLAGRIGHLGAGGR